MTSANQCFVLMPFEEALEPVFTDAIKPAVEQFAAQIPDLQINRADSVYSPRKMEYIRDQIRGAAIVIIDITGLRPAVMWELGFADACNKEMIVIGCVNPETLPFNLKNLDYIGYQPDSDGIRGLKHRLIRVVDQRITGTMKLRNSYLEHPRWVQAFQTAGIDFVWYSKVLHPQCFCCPRIESQPGSDKRLFNGEYLLRNERPMQEIIDCYCQLMGTLDNELCTFDTVTCAEFWRDFTEGGTDNRYSTANAEAAMRGAVIRRIFLFDCHKLRNEPIARNQLRTILDQHWEVTSPQRARVVLRVFHSPIVPDLRGTYENFALLQRNTEILLLRPTYDSGSGGKILDTKFWYTADSSDDDREDTIKLIGRYRDRFDMLWAKSEEFSPEVMEKYLDA